MTKDTLTNLSNSSLINCQLFEFFAQNLMIECRGCDDSTKSKEKIMDFMNELFGVIETTADQEPIIQHFGDYHLVLTQIIKKGHVTMHLSEGRVFLDIFSCTRFDIQKVKNHLIKHFSPKTIKECSLDRGI